MTRLGAWKKVGGVFVLWAAAAVSSQAQTFKSLVSFDGSNGAYPEYVSLVQGTDGNLYGTTSGGGAKNAGTVFKITFEGVLTTLYSFCLQTNCPAGNYPYGGLVLATDGNFYGTTVSGGSFEDGTVFRITPEGELTTLYSFCAQGYPCNDGTHPYGGLLQATDGNFYGTTSSGGNFGDGTVFKITAGGALTPLHSFGGPDGANPYAGLIQGNDGNLYGTTSFGGHLGNSCGWVGGCGTVFEVTQTGALTTLHSFNSNLGEGVTPYAALVQASDGNFYGTTYQGGGSLVCDNLCGTVFGITPDGTLTIQYNFCGPSNCKDGTSPYAALVQASDGNLYGTAAGGGPALWNGGEVFEMTTEGALTTPYGFCSQIVFYPNGDQLCFDGALPIGGLLQATNGRFYGTTYLGGGSAAMPLPLACQNPIGYGYGCGTVFSLDMGFGPFVRLQRYSGKVGQTGGILGQGFTGTTGVSINGTSASFTVRSDTFLTATVPAGATSGFVTVATPSGTLTSDKMFRVVP
jgi:uncharacterized repeat protein (TIGR03803 family)